MKLLMAWSNEHTLSQNLENAGCAQKLLLAYFPQTYQLAQIKVRTSPYKPCFTCSWRLIT